MTSPTNNVRWMAWTLVAILALATNNALGHGNGMATGGPGRMAVDPMIGQVDAGSGAVTESVVDFAMPSQGSGAVQWRHHRTYHSQWTGGDSDTVQGQRWFHDYLQNLTLVTPGSPSTSDVTWRSDAHHTYTFPSTGTYTYGPASNADTFAVLTHHDQTGMPYDDTYCLTFLDGTKMFFYDFTVGGTPQGKLKYIEDVYNQRLNVYYDGSNRVDYITDPSGHYFRYAYLSSGVNTGKLETVKAYVSSGTSTADQIAQIEFTYRDSTTPDSMDAGCGLTGDLVKVAVKTHKTGETSSTFSIISYRHYRYWSGTYNSSTNPGHDHELSRIFHPQHFDLADAAVSDPLTESNATLSAYATFKFEYNDSGNRCSKQTVAIGSGCGGCGGGGGDNGDYVLTYTTQTNTTRNDWAIRTKVEHNGWTRYYLCNNWGELYIDVLFTTDASTSVPLWIEKYDRDTSYGRVTAHYTPACFSNYNTSTHALTTNNDGRVVDYAYDSSSKQTQSRRARKYSEATSAALYEGYWVYASATFTGYRTRYLLSESYVFPTGVSSSPTTNGIKTAYDYVLRTDVGDRDGDASTSEVTDEPLVVRVTHPTVSTGQNGPNVAGVNYTWFNSVGQPQWFKNEEGGVRYQAYHDKTGIGTYSVTDPFAASSNGAIRPTGITSPDSGGWAAWSGGAPKEAGSTPFAFDFQTPGTEGDYMKLASKSTVDIQGRLRSSTDASGMISYVAYLDKETRSYTGWNSTTDKPFLPVSRSLTDREGRSIKSISVNGSTITFSDPPDGAEDLTDQTKWVSLSRTIYDNATLRVEKQLSYFLIPSSGDGTVNTNFYQTEYAHASNSGTKTTTVQVRDPQGGYSKSTKNPRGQTIKVEGTATESGGSPTSWKTLTEYFFDQATPGTGASQGGNGNLTQVKSYYDDTRSNSTAFHHDWRDRRLLTVPPLPPFTLVKYDNMGRTLAVGQFGTSTPPSASADPTSTTSNRLALSETFYNDRGQVYQSQQSSILASNGSKDGGLVSNQYYDRAGRSVMSESPAGGIHATKYNTAGMVSASYSAVDFTGPYSSGAFDYSNLVKVIEMAKPTFDSSGRTIEFDSYELEAGASAGINITTPGTNVVQFKSRSYYDLVGRVTHTTNFGSFDTGGVDGPMNKAHATIASYNPASPETASDTQLVSISTYGSDGRLSSTTDPSGVITNYEYDALGRQTAMIEDASVRARRTEFQYNGNSSLTKRLNKVVADYGYGAAGADDQVTQYVYGHTLNSRWLLEILAPGSDGQPSSSDKTIMTYHHDGQINTHTDRNGTVVTPDYDALRRVTQTRVTTVGSGLDTTLRRIATTYDDLGRIEKQTNYDNATVGSGTVLNEVKYTYNGLSQVLEEEQEHSGAVDGSTISVQYGYNSSEAFRFENLTYPNSRVVNYDYTGHTSLQSDINDAFTRVGRVKGGPSGSVKPYVEYSYGGLSRLIKRASKEDSNSYGNKTYLNHDAVYSTTDSADEYAGLDTFGRPIRASVSDQIGAASTPDIRTEQQCRYNRDGTIKFQEQQESSLLGEASLYSYNALKQIEEMRYGRLNSTRTAIAKWTPPQEQDLTLDIQGKATTVNTKNSGTNSSETRVYDSNNRMTSRTTASQAPIHWVDDGFSDATQWVTADVTNDAGGDGTWSASSSKLQNDTVGVVSGAPYSGSGGSIKLADCGAHQSFKISVDVTLTSSAVSGGLVFSYRDLNNYWLLVAKPGDTYRLYQKDAGTFVQRAASTTTLSSGGGSFTLFAYVHSQAVFAFPVHGSFGDSYTLSQGIPAGKVGVWAGSDSATVKFDNFKLTAIDRPYDVDGRWYANTGNVSVASGKLKLDGAAQEGKIRHVAIRRGYRGDLGIVQYSHPVTAWNYGGAVLHYQDPENYMAVSLNLFDNNTFYVVLYRVYQGHLSLIQSSSLVTGAFPSDGDTVKCVIANATSPDTGQRLKVYVAGTERLSSLLIDDTWSAGHVGVWQAAGTSAMNFDNFKVGYDKTTSPGPDGDIDDSEDEIQIDDNFDDPGGGVTWQKITRSYNNNGNLTDDGVYKYKYDAFGRPVEMRRRVDAENVVAAFTYDPVSRIISTAVTNSGVGNLDALGRTKPDGANRTLNFYHSGGQTLEVRDADSSDTLAQHVYDAGGSCPIFTDVNGDPIKIHDADPDNALSVEAPDVGPGGDGEDAAPDSRYFYHNDAAGRLVAITGYTEPTGKGGTDGGLWARIAHTPNGPLFLNNDNNGQELNSPSFSPPMDFSGNFTCGTMNLPEPVIDIPEPPAPKPNPNPCAFNDVDGREIICAVGGGNPQYNPASGECECPGSWTPPPPLPPIYIPGGGGGGGHPGAPAPWGPNGPGTGGPNGPGSGGPEVPGGGCSGAVAATGSCAGNPGGPPSGEDEGKEELVDSDEEASGGMTFSPPSIPGCPPKLVALILKALGKPSVASRMRQVTCPISIICGPCISPHAGAQTSGGPPGITITVCSNKIPKSDLIMEETLKHELIHAKQKCKPKSGSTYASDEVEAYWYSGECTPPSGSALRGPNDTKCSCVWRNAVKSCEQDQCPGCNPIPAGTASQCRIDASKRLRLPPYQCTGDFEP